MARHGPHHGAQKSTSTGVGDDATVESKLAAVSSVVFADMILEFEKEKDCGGDCNPGGDSAADEVGDRYGRLGLSRSWS